MWYLAWQEGAHVSEGADLHGTGGPSCSPSLEAGPFLDGSEVQWEDLGLLLAWELVLRCHELGNAAPS